MGIIRPMENEQAFLKMGLYGFSKSGKSFSASKFAIGLSEYIKSKTKQVCFFETETGSDYVKPILFDPAGVELVGVKSRAFVDCIGVIKECEDSKIPILIIDSVTHVWRELTESYMRTHNRKRLFFQDWTVLKSEWAKLTDAFLISKVHIIMCGRAGYEYDFFEDEDGKKQLEKTGIKMKVENEMGYEPALIVRMEREKIFENDGKQEFKRVAHVEGDRFDVIDGKRFENPTFENILPHIEKLNLGGTHRLFDPERNSDDALKDDNSSEHRRKRYKKAIGEIQAMCVEYIPGTGKDEKQAKVKVLKEIFDNRSWDAIEQMSVEELEYVLKEGTLEKALKNKVKELEKKGKKK